MDHLTDWQLLDQFLADGSHAAFEAIVHRHAGMVHATARRRLGPAGDALVDDVTQATFIILARKAGTIRRRGSLAAWLYRTASYAALDAARRCSARRRHEANAAQTRTNETASTPSDTWAAVAPHLDQAMQRLSNRDREAILLRFFEDRTLEQIAREQGVATSTAQRRIERGLRKLCSLLRVHDRELRPAALGAALVALGQSPASVSAGVGIPALAAASSQLSSAGAGSIAIANGVIKTMALTKLATAACLVLATGAVIGTGALTVHHALAQQSPPPQVAPADTTPPAPTPVPAAAPAQTAAAIPLYTTEWTYSTLQLTRYNPAVSNRNQPTVQNLTIALELKLSETGNIIGMGRSFNVTRMLDGDGNDISRLLNRPGNGSRSYSELRYNHRFDQVRQAFYDELGPQHYQLSLQLSEQLPQRIGLVEGSVMALVAGRIEHVDLPFVVGESREIVPGLTLTVTEAQGEQNRYTYTLSEGDQPTQRERGSRFTGHLQEDETLPERMVVERYLVDAEGQRIGDRRSGEGFGAGGPIRASGSGGGDYSRIAAIRFDVAVDPREQPLPVTIRGIDLPELRRAEQVLPQTAAPRDLPPIERMESALQRQLERQRENTQRTGWTDGKDQRMREQWNAFKQDFDKGAGVPLQVAAIKGLTPTVDSYDSYLGRYTIEEDGQAFESTVRKDDRGRFIVDTPEGPSPAVARDGALFAVFDDVLIASEDPLNPDAMPRLAGFWIVQTGDTVHLLMDTGRPSPEMRLRRVGP